VGLLLCAGLLLVGCTAAATTAPTPPSPIGAEATGSDTVAIYATVIRRLCTRDDSFGGTYNPAIVYLVRRTNDAAGDPRAPRGVPAPLSEAVQNGISAALDDLPGRIVWVDSPDDAPKDAMGAVEGHGVIVTLGSISPQEDGSVHVPASIYMASLAAAGQTYVLQQQGGAWVVTGNTGVQWMS